MKKQTKISNGMLIGMVAAGAVAGVLIHMIFSDARKEKENISSLTALKNKLQKLVQKDTTESYLEAATIRDAIKEKEAQNV
jgi:protein-arginine kinase activator protein McsA